MRNGYGIILLFSDQFNLLIMEWNYLLSEEEVYYTMNYVDLGLSPLLFFAESGKKSFYEDTVPSERVEASGVLLAGFEGEENQMNSNERR